MAEEMFGSEQKQVLPTPVEKIFTPEYVVQYELVSSSPSKPYEKNAQILAELGSGIQDNDVVVEIGCGTGNSTIVLAESNPNFTQLIGIEPSKAFLEVAKYKFGKTDVTLPAEITNNPQIADYVEEQKKRAEKFKEKVEFILGRADGHLLPLKDNSVNKIYLASVLHWLNFANGESANINYLDKALGDFQRVLKDDGLLIFDSSGLQFDFGSETKDGRPLNSCHLVGHPFHIEFLKNVGRVLERMLSEKAIRINLRETAFGTSGDVNYKKIDRYYHIFNWGLLNSKLTRLCFEVVPNPDGNPYSAVFMPISQETLIERTRDGARMRLFNSGELKDLPEDIKSSIIEEAMRETLGEHRGLLEQEAAEIMAYFVFRLKK